MLINESGLIRAIKSAYKNGGYVVANHGNTVSVYADNWYIQVSRALLPNKVLAAIVENMGVIPETAIPLSVLKDEEPQIVMQDVATNDMAHWLDGQRGEKVTMATVIMQGYQILQPPGGGACWGVPLSHLGMIERDVAEHSGADVIDDDRLLWETDGEVVVIGAVRKARSSWAKEWEQAVWTALESVDLHREEV